MKHANALLIPLTAFLLTTLFNCTHQIVRTDYTPDNTREANCLTNIVKYKQINESDGDKVGSVKLEDSGFSMSCSEEDAYNILKKEACLSGANVINITSEKSPHPFSTCYFVEADLFVLTDMALKKVFQSNTVYDYSELPAQPVPSMTLVYIVRPTALGFAIPMSVFVDEKVKDNKVGVTQGAQHIYFYLTPGKHIIISQSENRSDLEIEAKPGEVIFIEQMVQMGAVVARNKLKAVEPGSGIQSVKDTKTGNIIKQTY